MGTNPSNFKGDDLPVEKVSWNDAQAFLETLNRVTNSGRKYRLPTEAEWEYAAKGGAKSKGYKYAGSNDLNEVGWYDKNSDSKTHHPVGQKKPNELGLYDMSGNVWEWLEDDWHGDYKNAPTDGSAWVERGARGLGRVNRGGSWLNGAGDCRVSTRHGNAPGNRLNLIGFRLASSPQ